MKKYGFKKCERSCIFKIPTVNNCSQGVKRKVEKVLLGVPRLLGCTSFSCLEKYLQMCALSNPRVKTRSPLTTCIGENRTPHLFLIPDA